MKNPKCMTVQFWLIHNDKSYIKDDKSDDKAQCQCYRRGGYSRSIDDFSMDKYRGNTPEDYKIRHRNNFFFCRLE